MNNATETKMLKIALQFQAAGATMPIAKKRYDVIPVKNGGHKGIKVGGIHIWGVTCREYWQYLKSL